ncbi:RFC checkpoint protein Rad17 [Taxawa tesnikishii (nom. ined.)]|nr:RFC checkpoint protein Rad17 [Dothideales sp. JES 119]
MGQPRAARRKVVVISSDEENENVASAQEDIVSDLDDNAEKEVQFVKSKPRKVEDGLSTQSSKIRTSAQQPTPLTSTPNADEQPSQSPVKRRPKRTAPSEPKKSSKPIYSFFNAATQRQRSSQRSRSSSQKAPAPKHEEDDEEIQDAIPGEDTLLPFTQSSQPALALRKRKLLHNEQPSSSQSLGPPSGTQKFRKTSDGAKVSPIAQAEDRRPWTEQYAPVDVSELAVHKKKISDVRNLLNTATSRKDPPKLIVLRGPAGSGKTATVNLLAKEMGIEILEWKNPAGADMSSDAFVSASAQFEEFIARSGKFTGLTMVTDRDTGGAAISAGPDRKDAGQTGKQIILIEEFPNTFARSSNALQSFRSTMKQFLAAFSMPNQDTTPIVMIISETLLSTSTATADSFTAHRLLGPQILLHPYTVELEFNPVATTILIKGLEDVVRKESRKTGRKRTPGPQVLRHLAETGDIRSAVSSLEFLCLRGDEGDSWSAKVAFTKSKKAPREAPMTKQEQDALKLISNRESSLGIFHAVGRVVYNKRIDPPESIGLVVQPPNYFPQHRRPNIPEANVDTLIDELGTDTSTFLAALHENYALSCITSSAEESMDSLNGCIDMLSDADLLSPDRFSFGTRAFAGSGNDNLRQDDLSFQVAVRGLLFNLPSPVTRGGPAAQPGKGRGGDAFKMYYPTSLKLWKRREETEGALDIIIAGLQSRKPDGGIRDAESSGGARGVESWRRNFAFDQSPEENPIMGMDERASIAPPLLTSSIRTEMLLERLPYLAQICASRADIDVSIRERITDVVSMSGRGVAPSEEEPDVEEQQHGIIAVDWTERGAEDLRVPKLGKGTGKGKCRGRGRETEGEGLNIPVEHEVEKLVLSDDDIVDD